MRKMRRESNSLLRAKDYRKSNANKELFRNVHSVTRTSLMVDIVGNESIEKS